MQSGPAGTTLGTIAVPGISTCGNKNDPFYPIKLHHEHKSDEKKLYSVESNPNHEKDAPKLWFIVSFLNIFFKYLYIFIILSLYFNSLRIIANQRLICIVYALLFLDLLTHSLERILVLNQKQLYFGKE